MQSVGIPSLWTFGIFYGHLVYAYYEHLVYFVVNWYNLYMYIFSFCYVVQGKTWQP
jgi:hypothetical protein